MATHKLMVYSGPVAGREEEYNQWYSNTHLADVLKVPGVVAAQRFSLPPEEGAARYVAIYELETADPTGLLNELQQRVGSAAMPMSDSLDTRSVAMTLLTAVSDRVQAG